MSIQYRVYAGVNVPVDYSAPLVTTASLTADMPALPPDAVATYVVRAFDTVSGLEDQSTQARVTVRTDGEGEDVTGYPAAPAGLTARAGPGGTATVRWVYPLNGGAAGFRVYLGTPTVPDYSSPAAVVATGVSGQPPAVVLSGLTPGTTYAVAVRAFSGAGEEQNTATASVTAASAGPSAPVAVSATSAP